MVNISSLRIYRHDYGHEIGVCIYNRDDLKATEISIAIDEVEGVEDIWITV